MEKLLSLAQKISTEFPRFYLAGGTAIMFKYQHRESIDLDFFNGRSFSFRYQAKKVRDAFEVENEVEGQDNIDLFIDGVKVSFVYFPFASIKKTENWQGIRIASDADIFLNKVYAAGRRIDWKDPFDAAFLWEKNQWPMEEAKKDFECKFPDQSFEIHLGAMASLEDYPELPEEKLRLIQKMVEEVRK